MKLFKKVIAVLAIATMSLSMVACGTSKAATEMGSKDEKGLIVARVCDVPIYKTSHQQRIIHYEHGYTRCFLVLFNATHVGWRRWWRCWDLQCRKI